MRCASARADGLTYADRAPVDEVSVAGRLVSDPVPPEREVGAVELLEARGLGEPQALGAGQLDSFATVRVGRICASGEQLHALTSDRLR